MTNFIKGEPVAFFGGLQGVLVALAGMLIAFNAWNPTEIQLGAASAFYAALAAFVTFLVRQSVTPYPGGPLTPTDD